MARFEPSRGQHVANGAGSGVYMGPVALTRRQAAADPAEALAALTAAAPEAEQLGMVPFTEWIGQLRTRLSKTATAGIKHGLHRIRRGRVYIR